MGEGILPETSVDSGRTKQGKVPLYSHNVVVLMSPSRICIGAQLQNELPENPYKSHFGPDYSLHPDLSGMARFDNKNSRKSLEQAMIRVLEQLRYLNGAPSVQMSEIPPDIGGLSGK